MHDMIDPKKIKELQKEVKVIEKTLKKYQKQLEKLKSKNKHVGAEDTEDSTEEKEEIIDENMEDMDGVEDPLMEVLTPEEEKELNDIEDEIRYKANSNRVSFNSRMQERYKELKDKQNQMPAPPEKLNIDINESFLYMQKLAGLITEGQYRAKSKKF
jgi:Spy/CpxP family protein refolding chaperone